MADQGRIEERWHVRPLHGGHVVIRPAWWRYPGCSFPHWTYYVNARPGAALRLADGSTWPVVPGRVHFIPARVQHDLATEADVPHLWATFDLVGLPGPLVREVFPRPRAVPLRGAVAASAAGMRAAIDAGGIASPRAQFAIKAAIYAALSALFERLSGEETRRLLGATAPGSPIAPAIALIERDLARPFANRELARACGLSEHHFIRVFRRHLGQTPAQYVLDRRIAAAASSLALEGASIEAIAEAHGFPDRYYFTRMFARHMGMPPATFRRRFLASRRDAAAASA